MKKLKLLSLEPRILLDAAAVASAVEADTKVADQTADSQQTQDSSVDSTKSDTSNVDAGTTSIAAPELGSGLVDATAQWTLTDVQGATLNQVQTHELVVVDTSIANYQALLEGVNPDAEKLYLDPTKDGIQQITDALKGRTDIAEIHILSHGKDGTFALGTTILNNDNVQQYQTQLTEIGKSLTDNGDILIYGCNVTDGETKIGFVSELTDLSKTATTSSDASTGTSLFELGSSTSNYKDVLDSAEKAVQDTLTQWFQKDDALSQLAMPFSATAGTGNWTDNALALQKSILDGSYSIRVEVLNNTDMQGTLGAYSAIGTSGEATIYLNADWLANASVDSVKNVLLEEIGHDFDQHLNGDLDSGGDEGAIFSALAQNNTFSEQDLQLLQQENDTGSVLVDGQQIAIEKASSIEFAPTSTKWTNLSRTGDPNKAASDGSWTAAASDFAGDSSHPYIQIQADGLGNIAFKVLAEPQSGDFKALMGVFIDIDGDGSPDLTVQLNVANVTGGYSIVNNLSFTFIPIFKNTLTVDANTRPNNTVIPSENTGTYFDLRNETNTIRPSNVKVYSSISGADGSIISDVDADGNKENYYEFSFSLTQLAAFRTFIANKNAAETDSTKLYKEIPTWPTQQTKIYAAALSASNSLNAINGDIGGGPYTPGDTWKDIFGWKAPLPPVGVNDSATLLEGSTLVRDTVTRNLLANDTDGNGDPLRVSQFTVAGDATVYTISAGSSATATTSGGSVTIFSDGSYSFTPKSTDYAGPVPTVTYTVTDIDNLSSTGNLSISITPVNDEPLGQNHIVTLNEEATYTFSASDFGFSDPVDGLSANASVANTLKNIIIDTLPVPATGTLYYNGVAITVLTPNLDTDGNGSLDAYAIAAANISKLTYAPAPNSTTSASFNFQLQDNGGIANGGDDLSQVKAITFNVNPVNDAPAGTDKTITTNEDTAYAFTAADFGFTDPNDSPANALQSVIITTLPTTGTLKIGATAVTLGQELTLAQIATLTYTPALNGNGTSYANFTFQVRDDGGTANGGANLDLSPNTITVNVTAVNDAPIANPDFNSFKEPAVLSTVTPDATGNVILPNDTDVDNTTASLIVTQANKGTTLGANPITTIVAGTGTTATATERLLYNYFSVNGNKTYAVGTVVTFDPADTDNTGLALPTGGVTVTACNSGGTTYITLSKPLPISTLTTLLLGGTAETPLGVGYSGTLNTPYLSEIYATSVTGTITAGMNVTGVGVATGATVSSVDGNYVTLSAAMTNSTGGDVLTFKSTVNTIQGDKGYLELYQDGSYKYFLTDSSLNDGQTYDEHFTYQIKDPSNLTSTAVLTIHIEGRSATPPTPTVDTVNVTEGGGASNTGGTSPLKVIATSGVLANDKNSAGTLNTNLNVISIATNPSAPTTVTTSYNPATDTGGTSGIIGTYGTLTIGLDGAYKYVLNETNSSVEALRTSSDHLSDVFYYTVKDTSTNTTNTSILTVTILGNNDNPIAVADTATATEAGGTANNIAGLNPTGNVLSNDTDVDSGDTKIVSKIIAGVAVPTAFSGTVASSNGYGTLTIAANGAYTYVVNNSDTSTPLLTAGYNAINALGVGQTLTDTFTYEVQDTAGGTHTNTLIITINGANDAPVNTVPGTTQTVAESATLNFSSANSNLISVADVDTDGTATIVASELNTVTLTVNNGSLTIGTLGSAILTGSGGNITLSGTQSAINAALATLSYTGNQYFSGTDALTITSTDGLGLQDIDVVAITVTADNRTLTTSNISVNEGSSYAVFTVAGEQGQKVSLTLATGTATSGDDFSPNLEYWDGSAWATYLGSPVIIPTTVPGGLANSNTGNLLFVRTAILNDKTYEGGETFTLRATNSYGNYVDSTATIKDDGTGTTFTSTTGISDGTADGTVTKDDDRPLTVNDITVNEGSSYAIFTVTGVANQWLKMNLVDGTAKTATSATLDQTNDYGVNGSTIDLQYWSGSAWVDYDLASPAFIQMTAGTLLVRTPIINDNPVAYEGSENFVMVKYNRTLFKPLCYKIPVQK